MSEEVEAKTKWRKVSMTPLQITLDMTLAGSGQPVMLVHRTSGCCEPLTHHTLDTAVLL